GNLLYTYYHVLTTRVLDRHCFASKKATKNLIKKIEEISPDLIQLHNLHGYYLNIELLFNFLKSVNIPVVWSLHDAWALTGHCTQFEHIKCMKWKEVCHKCPQSNEYPASYFSDNSRKNHLQKKELFTSVKNLHLITSSAWSADLIAQSFLSDFDITIIPNGVDQEIFKPRQNSEFRINHNIEGKFVVLGVSNVWNSQKGYHDFIKLSSLLDKDTTLVMVGLTEIQLKNLPNNIIGVQRTANTKELAELYSMSDVYVNLTYADTFPTTNLEALSCGTPIITYNTGGSVESVNEHTGYIVEQGEINKVLEKINLIKKSGKNKYQPKCLTYARENYNMIEQYLKYINLYKPLMEI
ncbi:MAG: glycosyltransferase, partial [Eudoraea sp.]|nr:glycosyltransferase [Eudoraea sp.]